MLLGGERFQPSGLSFLGQQQRSYQNNKFLPRPRTFLVPSMYANDPKKTYKTSLSHGKSDDVIDFPPFRRTIRDSIHAIDE